MRKVATVRFRPSGQATIDCPTFGGQDGVPVWAMYAAATAALFTREDTRKAVIEMFLERASEFSEVAGHA